MTRLFGPLLPFELARVVRRRRYFLWRTLYATAMLFYLFVMIEEMLGPNLYQKGAVSPAAMSRFSHSFGIMFGILQLVVVLLATPAYVAPCIAEEREKRSLDMLLTTPLSRREIVMGKWGARVINLGLLLAASMPILAVSLWFGGINPNRLLLLAALTLSTLMASSAIAVASSSQSATSNKAYNSAYGAVFLLFLVMPWAFEVVRLLLVLLLRRWNLAGLAGVVDDTARPVLDVIACVNPIMVYASDLSMRTSVWTQVEQIFWAVALHAGICAAGIWNAVHFCVSEAAAPPARKKLSIKGWLADRRAKIVLPLVGEHPVAWKEWHFQAGKRRRPLGRAGLLGLALGGAMGMIAVLTTAAAIGTGKAWDTGVAAMISLPIVMGVQGILAFVSFFHICGSISTSISAERNKDTWVSLLAAPLSGREIALGKIVGAMRLGLHGLAAAAGIWFVALFTGGLCPLAIPLMAAGTIALFALFGAVGVRQSVVCRTEVGSTLSTIAIVYVCISLVLFMSVTPAMVMFEGRGQAETPWLGPACVAPAAAFPWEALGDWRLPVCLAAAMWQLVLLGSLVWLFCWFAARGIERRRCSKSGKL